MPGEGQISDMRITEDLLVKFEQQSIVKNSLWFLVCRALRSRGILFFHFFFSLSLSLTLLVFTGLKLTD